MRSRLRSGYSNRSPPASKGRPDAQAWRRRAKLLVDDGRADQAIAELEGLGVRPGDTAGVESILANTYIAAGDASAAEAVLRARWMREATAASAANLVDYLHRTARPSEALAVIEQQLSNEAENDAIDLAYLRIALLLELGETDAAREHFAVFSARDPVHSLTRYLRARFDLVAGRPEAAAARLKLLLPRLDRPDVHHWLAVALEQSGDEAGAEQRYGVAIYAEPTQIASYHGLLRTLARRHAWSQVEQWSRRLLRRAPDSPVAYEALVRGAGRAG